MLCVLLSPKSKLLSNGEMEFQLWLITVYKSCSCNLNVLPNSVHVYCPTWHHLFSVANIRQHSDSIRPRNLFACLQQNPSNFIKARAAGKCMTADLVIRHTLPTVSRTLLRPIFLCGKVPLPRLHSFPIKPASSDSNYSNYSSQGCEWERGERGMASLHTKESRNASVVRSLQWQQQQQQQLPTTKSAYKITTTAMESLANPSCSR